MNAMWWVYYTDKNNPARGRQILSLMSRDLRDPRKAKKRASTTARERLKRKGVNPIILDVQCVG